MLISSCITHIKLYNQVKTILCNFLSIYNHISYNNDFLRTWDRHVVKGFFFVVVVVVVIVVVVKVKGLYDVSWNRPTKRYPLRKVLIKIGRFTIRRVVIGQLQNMENFLPKRHYQKGLPHRTKF
jgi:hypothetical protein